MSVRNALRGLLALTDLKEQAGKEVAFSGDDPVFPTPYLVGAPEGDVGSAERLLPRQGRPLGHHRPEWP
jgi:hypothetical protein